MVAHGVTFLGHPAGEGRVAAGGPADHEEGGAAAVAGEQVEELWGGFRIRTVVEGQGDRGHVGVHPDEGAQEVPGARRHPVLDPFPEGRPLGQPMGKRAPLGHGRGPIVTGGPKVAHRVARARIRPRWWSHRRRRKGPSQSA
jgi:hypothetical protein